MWYDAVRCGLVTLGNTAPHLTGCKVLGCEDLQAFLSTYIAVKMRGTIDVELQSRLVSQIIMTDRAPELLQLRVRNPVWVHDTTRKNVEKTLLYC